MVNRGLHFILSGSSARKLKKSGSNTLVAIEIKSAEEVKTRHKNGLKAFHEEHPDCRLILVSLDPITRKSGDIELICVLDFLKMLWNGEIF